MKISEMVKKALEMSERSELRTFRHGCVLIKRNKIFSKGCNKYSQRYMNLKNRYTASCHAELDCIRNCVDRRLLEGSILCVVRTNASGDVSDSKPCQICLSMIKNYKIKKIIFSTSLHNIVGIIRL